ncbi:MAG: serine/threonine protein kinase [Burkholderiales bacterium]|nr:serine/threonine protein kinase [Burkholderiales bacterium]
MLGELGRGAMGIVYEAVDDVLDRPVAIKTINMSGDLAERADHEARFMQEARAAGGLSHPNVITVYDVGREQNVLYMAMELLDGEELRDLLGRGRLPLATAVEIAAQIAEGLAFAHERGIVHRDVKPSNIMVMRGNRAKITDFGIARVRTSEVKTQTGLRLGSPRYMSPEQVLGQPVDARADIFALGVVLYEMLAGVPPFGGDDVQAIMYRVTTFEPPAPSRLNPAVPTMLDLVVARALAKDPARRYPGAEELAADVRASLSAAVKPAGAAAPTPAPVPAAGVDRSAFTQTMPLPAATPVRKLARAWRLRGGSTRMRRCARSPRRPGRGAQSPGKCARAREPRTCDNALGAGHARGCCRSPSRSRPSPRSRSRSADAAGAPRRPRASVDPVALRLPVDRLPPAR